MDMHRQGGLRAMLAAPDARLRWSDGRLLAGMLAFELALAEAESGTGVIPADAGARITAAATDFVPDAAGIGMAGRAGGTLAIPFVKALTAHVAARDADAARWVHWGATSQDVVDTASVLAARDLHRAFLDELRAVGDLLAALARSHADTPMAGRTLLQQAVPVSFGWKAAGWLDATRRARDAMRRLDADGWPLQCGGAAGTLAALDGRGLEVAGRMARTLSLSPPAISWHGHRDRVARWVGEWAVTAGTLAKIGRDVSLMMQPEVGEAAEPGGEGRGGSSAMPHKANPVGSMLALEAAMRLPGLVATALADLPGEHERGLGHWQHTAFVLADAADATGSVLAAVRDMLTGLRVDAARMGANIDAAGGFVFAESLSVSLGRALGKAAAHARVEALCRGAIAARVPLADAVRAAARHDAELAAALEGGPDPFDPVPLLRDARRMTEAVVAAWEASTDSVPPVA